MKLKNIKAAYRVSVKGIVRDGNRILFVRERGDTWDLPGGDQHFAIPAHFHS